MIHSKAWNTLKWPALFFVCIVVIDSSLLLQQRQADQQRLFLLG